MDKTRGHSHHAASIWFPLALMLVVLLLRVLAQQGVIPNLNMSPIMAFAFVGAIVLPRPLPWWSWAIILLGVDLASQGAAVWNPENRWAIALSYSCFIFAAWWGGRMREGAGILNTLGGTVLCSLLFYVVTNTFCWMAEPFYERSFGGWVQCLTVGTPGYPPTWIFFRNSLFTDLIGASVLLLAYNSEAVLRGLRALPWVGSRNTTLATA